MYDHPYNYARSMKRAYRALAARDLDGFAKPLARDAVPTILRTIGSAFAVEVEDLTLVATDFTLGRGRLRVTGHCEATVRDEPVRLRAPFHHDWALAYGVAWRLTQHVGPAIRCVSGAD